MVQKKVDGLCRELLPDEITDPFEQTYFLTEHPRFNIIDYSISVDQSHSPTPLVPGKTQATGDFDHVFDGNVIIDGKEYKLQGRGNGPISSLANALKSIGIDIDVNDYREHSIGEGRHVKAVTYIEYTISGIMEKVWGVGIHGDVTQISLIALLSAASNVCFGK